jgi:hypothetical protein
MFKLMTCNRSISEGYLYRCPWPAIINNHLPSGLRPQKYTLTYFQELEVGDQGVDKAVLLPQALSCLIWLLVALIWVVTVLFQSLLLFSYGFLSCVS